MKIKNKKIILFCIIIIIAIIAVCIYINKIKTFKLDNINKYVVTTNTKFMTMQNDGGSYTNTYYEIDLENNIVRQCEDKYKGFKGYVYKHKIIYTKILSDDNVNDFKLLINNIENNGSESEDKIKSFDYYTFSNMKYNEIRVYDKDIIKQFIDIVKND